MPVRTPEPRIPLEPEEYPLYKPPSRIGCSGLSIVALVTILIFGVLLVAVAPPIIRGITGKATSFLPSDQSTPDTTPGSETTLATQTAISAVVPPTATPAAPPTPVKVCAKVTGTGKEGTPLREQPRTDARRVIPAGPKGVQEGAVFQIIGPDVTGGQDTAGKPIVWKHVELPNDGRQGYILAKFLQDTPCP